jgi:hypothetical protein
MTTQEFRDKARLVHGDLIDCTNIDFNGDLKRAVTIYCTECNQSYNDVLPTQLLKGYSCPYHSTKAKEFIKKGVEKYGDKYEYITDRNNSDYWGIGITGLSSENCKIGVRCKKHNNIFETHADTFLSGKELCPICKFEESKINISIRNVSNYSKNGEIYVHNDCSDKKLISKISVFLKKNTTALDNYWKHNVFINEDYTIDVEIVELNDLNKEWRGLTIRIDDNGKIPDFIQFGIVITSELQITRFNNSDGKNNVKEIKNLIGLPMLLYGNLKCVNIDLKSIIGVPEEIYGNFNVKNNNIECLEGCPKIIHGDFDISNNKIMTIAEFNDVDCEVFGKLNRKNNLFVE